ncbi:MAG: FAD-dependent oxidoreductase, partial [Acinetobacter sp.]|nr:FAD-dependent oxidoreductase [Acinetobacter sp.]
YSGNTFSKDYLKKLLFNFFNRIANDPFATNLELLSSNYKNYEGYFEGDEVIFPNGYAQVIDVLSKKIDIQFNIDVKKIICENDYVKIIDSNDNFYIASRVVVTVPLGILKKNHIAFYPALPHHYAQSIQDIGFGSFNKVFFELEQPLSFRSKMPIDKISDFYWNELGCFNILDLSGIYKKPIYLMLFGGKQSEFIDNSVDHEISNFIFSSLQKQFNNIPHTPKKLIVTRWGSDPYSYGSFSFPSLKHSEDIVKVLHKPIREQIFFAGEHCSLKYAGTVHGAYLNGDATAQKILAEVPLI